MEQATMDTNGMAPEGSATPVESPLLNDPGSSSLEQELGLQDTGTGQAGAVAQGGFKFAGRNYASQQAAEKWANELRGKHSETQGVMNMVKKALNNPELLEALQNDPQWAPILEKLGIEAEARDVQRQDARDRQQQADPQQMHREWQIERDIDRIEREEYRFERQLGRALSPEERRNTLLMIKQADTLSFEQAYWLGNRDAVMAQARQAAPVAPNGQRPAGSSRPAPPPVRGSQGGPVNSKKPVHQMKDAEWKENFRNSDEFKEIMSRRG
jgi:hypothetical protein